MSKLYDQLRNAARARSGENDAEAPAQTPALLAQALQRAQALRVGRDTQEPLDLAAIREREEREAEARKAAEDTARAKAEQAQARQEAAEAAAREEQARAEHAERLAQWANDALVAEKARIAAEERLRDRAKMRAEAAEKRRVSIEARDAASRTADQIAAERAALERSEASAPKRDFARGTLAIGLIGGAVIAAIAWLQPPKTPVTAKPPAPAATVSAPAVAKAYSSELKLETALDPTRLNPRTGDAARSSLPDPAPSR